MSIESDLKNMIINIRNNVDVVHADYSCINGHNTIYLWTYLNSEKNVEKIANKLYPFGDKITLKINKTNSVEEIKELKEVKEYKCTIS